MGSSDTAAGRNPENEAVMKDPKKKAKVGSLETAALRKGRYIRTNANCISADTIVVAEHKGSTDRIKIGSIFEDDPNFIEASPGSSSDKRNGRKETPATRSRRLNNQTRTPSPTKRTTTTAQKPSSVTGITDSSRNATSTLRSSG